LGWRFFVSALNQTEMVEMAQTVMLMVMMMMAVVMMMILMIVMAMVMVINAAHARGRLNHHHQQLHP
jgi:threonine/homoserine/homoserine lactone efflux protein